MLSQKILEIIQICRIITYTRIVQILLLTYLGFWLNFGKFQKSPKHKLIIKLEILVLLLAMILSFSTDLSYLHKFSSLVKPLKENNYMTPLEDKFTQAEQDEIRKQIDALLADVFGEAHNADVPQGGRKVMCDGSADNPSSGNLP